MFADKDLEENLLTELRAAKIDVDTTTHSIGTALRIVTKGESKQFFELAYKWWQSNRNRGALVTFRTSSGQTIELKESTVSEVRKIIEAPSRRSG